MDRKRVVTPPEEYWTELEEESSMLKEHNKVLKGELDSLSNKFTTASKYKEFLERLILKAMKQV